MPNRDTLIFGIFLLLFIAINGYFLATARIPADWSGFGLIVAVGLTLAMYSFLYKDNPLFKFAEHLYVGVGTGYSLVAQNWYTVLLADVFNPLFRPEPGRGADWSLLLPAALGVLILTRFSSRIGWLSRLSFAFVVGIGAGFGIPRSIASFLLAQMEPSLRPLWTAEGGFSLDLLIILVGVVTVLIYFFFSVEHRGPVGAASRVGIWFLMISFGASFGYTIMARLSLLIGRVYFLLRDWLKVIQ